MRGVHTPSPTRVNRDPPQNFSCGRAFALSDFRIADLESGALSIRNPQPEIRNPQLTVLQPVLARAGSGQFLIVRHENGSQPVLEMQGAKKFPDGLPGVRIQISGGLIGEQQPWFPDEGASE